MLSYLQKNCINTTHCSSKQYWTILKPSMSNKGASRNCEISLLENDQVVNNQKEVASILNDYYVNISRAIGEPDYMVDSDNIDDIFMCHKSHRSVLFIKEYMAINHCDVEPFKFRLVSKDAVLRVITIMDGQKATVNDLIPPKLLKASAHYLCDTITFIINKCIIDSSFPDDLKLADVIPLSKKDDMLNKQNYRPVSILSCISKVFERLLIEQLELYFSTVFSPFLTGYRTNLINHLCYADDLCLIALRSSGMQCLLDVCDKYATGHQLTYNATKSFTLCFKPKHSILHLSLTNALLTVVFQMI